MKCVYPSILAAAGGILMVAGSLSNNADVTIGAWLVSALIIGGAVLFLLDERNNRN